MNYLNTFLVEIGAKIRSGAGVELQKRARMLVWLGAIVFSLSAIEVFSVKF